jgi:alkanesulfonate monooxygenase SsuD/methylene tetrahydromethanopterin reductase-like flavin-dependent oxidoreductase (luciferase family)
MDRPLHFGVTLPQIKRGWQEARAAAESFDRLGFDSVWVCDHLYGVPMPQLPILEAWTELAAVAAVTEQVKLGTLVTPPFFRNPAVLAKQIATIDQIAPGRVIAGLGGGWFQAEFEAYGVPFPSTGERLAALEEMTKIMKSLWTDERTSFEGRHFQVRDCALEPKPAQRPAVLIGGSGEKVLMGIAAREADIWNNMAVFQGQLEAKVGALRKRCEEVGRDPDELIVSQQCTVVIAEDEATAKQHLEKAHKVYGGHMGAGLEAHGIWGAPDRVIDCIERHRELGCTMFVIEFFGRDTRVPAELFAETILRHYRPGQGR